MKRLIFVLSALIAALSLSGYALADGEAGDMASLMEAIDAAAPGDCITLAGGVYAPEGGTLTLTKPVSLAAEGEVEFRGAVLYDLAGTSAASSVSLTGISFTAVEGVDCGAALVSGRGRVLNITDCSFSGWLYGAAVYPECRSSKLNISGSSFDVFCAASVAEVNGNGVLGFDLSGGLYQYHKYGGAGSGFYKSYDESSLAAADYVPSGEVEACWPASARIGDRFYESLAGALGEARRGDTVYAVLGLESAAGSSVTVPEGVTLDVQEDVRVFEQVVNNGALINRGYISGGVSGRGESLTLVDCALPGSDVGVRVTDRAGREFEGENGVYLLPPGSYTFSFSGEAWYGAEVPVEVGAQRALTVDPSLEPKLSFSDVDSGDWFYEEVFSACSAGLMDGVSATAFDPDGAVTRGMAVTVIYRMAGEPAMPEAAWGYPYKDVDADAWYAVPVYWARLNGVVSGLDESSFAPGGQISREQLAVMLCRYAGFAGLDTSPGSLEGFADAGSVSAWAADAMAWAVGHGIISGDGSGALDPQGGVSRAQLAAMLVRMESI